MANVRLGRSFYFIVVLVAALLIAYFVFGRLFGYVIYSVDSTEVGIRFRGNNPYEVVPPGRYTRFGLFEEMRAISISGLPFSVTDPEILTKDQQRLGYQVAGTIHRPGVEKMGEVITNWANYSIFYTNDQALVGNDTTPGLVTNIAKQAMKVCVGAVDFSNAVVGNSRDALRQCIDTELDKLATGYALEVRNIVVPEVVLGEAVQKKLDEITDARFTTQVAVQREEQARAEAERDLAVQQGQIRVEQGKIQEKARQDALTAELNKATLEAQKNVIEAQKSNDLLGAQRDLEIATARNLAATEQALADLAPEMAKATMYQGNPAYTSYLETQALASAYSKMDKMIIPANVDPYLFLGGNPTVTVPAEAAAAPPQ
jgi:hypothetical protein